MTIIAPLIHSNGSNKESLRQDYHQAYLNLQESIKAFRYIDFNGRDYPLNFEKANEDRKEMWNKLSVVSSYLAYHVDFLSK